MNTRKPKPSEDYTKASPDGEVLHDEQGREIPDPTPMQPPLGYNPQPSLSSQIRAMILSEELRRAAEQSGAESFEEADDFEIGDDFDAERSSPYEANFDPMTPEERAALSTQGKDPEKILTPAEKAAFSKAQKKKASGDQPDPAIRSDSGESNEAENED